MEVDGLNLAVGGGAVTAIAGVFGAWIKARFGKTSVSPVPLPIEKQKDYVTVQECNRKMCDLSGRIDRVADGQCKILDKLDEMDDKSERRAKETHDRIDPIAERLGEQIGQVKLIKETFLRSIVGGKEQ